MANVSLKKISKTYPNGFRAFSNQSLEIQDGEFMVLVGPSGCAKTTALNMIAGLEDVTDGEVVIKDRVVNGLSPKDRNIAMVFQNYALYPHMTIYQNMAFGLKLRKYTKERIDEEVGKAAKILGIEDLLERKPSTLSGGQKQRVALGRAIVRHPDVFLFDEPLSNLDAKLRVQMRVEIKKIHQRLKNTMVYVTHDQVEAMTMGDRITVMNKGQIQQVDTPHNLYHHPINKFVATFIGSPAMNIISGKLLKEGVELYFVTSEGIKLKIPEEKASALDSHCGKKVYLGVRPEDISLSGAENSFEAEIEVLEQMGNETFVYFSVEGNQFISRMPSNTGLTPGSNKRFFVDMLKCHFFDEETGENLG